MIDQQAKIYVSSIEGNRQRLDGGSMFGNAPKAVWQKWCQPDELDRIELACRCLLIEWNDRKILLETGVGCFFSPKLADRYGVVPADKHVLLDELEKRNISHQDITDIILSHLHFDHAGGLLSSYKEGHQPELLFPNAKFFASQGAIERCRNPHKRDKASFIPGLLQMLEDSNRLHAVEGDSHEALPPFLRFKVSHGHTPHQLHTVLMGEDVNMIFCGDLIPGLPWVHVPITMGYDRFAEKVIDEKMELYDEIFSDNCWILFFTHDSKVSGARITKGEKDKVVAGETFASFDKFPIAAKIG